MPLRANFLEKLIVGKMVQVFPAFYENHTSFTVGYEVVKPERCLPKYRKKHQDGASSSFEVVVPF
jgi:hypothetical protein